jgi:hypothetical protein
MADAPSASVRCITMDGALKQAQLIVRVQLRAPELDAHVGNVSPRGWTGSRLRL